MLHSGPMNRPLVFYKLYSNLGIRGTPLGQNERNDGVYYGPDAVLSAEFLQQFSNARVLEFKFPKNDATTDEHFYQTVAQESGRCADDIVSHLAPADMLVAIGGDNSVTLPALLADIARFGAGAIGVITFDTHGDIHLAATTPSGNFHGVFVRPFFDTFDVPEIDKLVPQKLKGSDIIYFGNFDFEQEEIDFMDRKKIRRYSLGRMQHAAQDMETTLQRFLNAHAHVHINFDIDVFDESLVTATGMPSANGVMKEDIFPLLARIATHPSKTLSLSEINPEKKGAHKTVQLAHEVIETLTSHLEN